MRIVLPLAAVLGLMGLVLFASAGTFSYWQAWLYLAMYELASIAITLYLAKADPALLERRMRGGPTAEQQPAQKVIMGMASVGFIAVLLVPALDIRFGWSNVPVAGVIVGDALMLACFVVVFIVFRFNTFAAATVQVAEKQTVISTGPYAYVRHPMYAGALLLFIGTPPALGSFWGLVALVLVVPALIWRLLDEERLLMSSLPGYAEYCAGVRWRLIPGVF
jgi:protein-S-isoprenylcysteine O-methyltransferase Ste14